MASPSASPPPARSRTGTFDGLDKVFFDRARAIEAGEMTAPPEVIGRPRTAAGRLRASWHGLALHQQIAIVVAAALMAVGAFIVF